MNPDNPDLHLEVFAGGLDHPECCAFDRDGRLWAGGEAGQIYRIDPTGKSEIVANVGGFCGGIAFRPDEREIFVCVAGRGVIRFARNGAQELFAASAGQHAIVAANHLVFDRRGRLYVTDSGNWMRGNGFVLRFDAVDAATKEEPCGEVLAGPFGYVNGLALSADERHLYVVESDTDSVLRFQIGENARLGEAEVYANDIGRFPDGLAFDAQGNLYVCCYASDEIWRIGPDRVKTRIAHDRWGILLGGPTNLAFGGKEFDEIFVANLGRTTITRVKLGIPGQPLANLLFPEL